MKEVALEEDRAYATRSESEFASRKALHDIGEKERDTIDLRRTLSLVFCPACLEDA